MSSRVTSDDLPTHRARVARSGGTRRPCLRLPAELDLSDGQFVRVVLDREEYHARVTSDATGPMLRGAYDNKRLARNPGESENRLVAWLRERDREPGSSVDLDVVTPGEQFGVRAPGERVVYEAKKGPKDSLASIAEKLDGGRDPSKP